MERTWKKISERVIIHLDQLSIQNLSAIMSTRVTKYGNENTSGNKKRSLHGPAEREKVSPEHKF